jgi:hypothetical protein
MKDHYELLQVSRNADSETIHRVYRIMAARFHPDNPTTGHVETFLAIERAYRILADPIRRAQYDATCPTPSLKALPIMDHANFTDDDLEGEWCRRLGVLSLLYQQCRIDADHPGVSVLDVERRLKVPQEQLAFTLWYLKAKGYLAVCDNTDYALSALGVDYFESKSSAKVVLKQLEPAA